MIEAIDAHIWWDPDTKRVLVISFPSDVKGFLCDAGASEVRWRTEYRDSDRVREMTDMALELLFDGYEPHMVIREFAKIRQFRELGMESWPMARVLAAALGSPREYGPDEFKRRFLDGY